MLQSRPFVVRFERELLEPGPLSPRAALGQHDVVCVVEPVQPAQGEESYCVGRVMFRLVPRLGGIGSVFRG